MKNRGSSIRSRGWVIGGKYVSCFSGIATKHLNYPNSTDKIKQGSRILQFQAKIPRSSSRYNLREHSKLPAGTAFNFHRSRSYLIRFPRLVQVRNTRSLVAEPPSDLNLSAGKCVEPSSRRRLQFKHLPVSISAGDAVDKLAWQMKREGITAYPAAHHRKQPSESLFPNNHPLNSDTHNSCRVKNARRDCWRLRLPLESPSRNRSLIPKIFPRLSFSFYL